MPPVPEDRDDDGIGQAWGMTSESSGPAVTVFRSRLRFEAGSLGYAELAARMEERARHMPGFLDFKTFQAADGERVSIIVFDSLEHQNAWRDDPEHRQAQRKGRDSFYEEYTISVCEERHRRSFRRRDETGHD